MTLKKIKKMVDERKISELLKYFYIVMFRKSGIEIHGNLNNIKIPGYKKWNIVDHDTTEWYWKKYKGIEIILFK